MKTLRPARVTQPRRTFHNYGTFTYNDLDDVHHEIGRQAGKVSMTVVIAQAAIILNLLIIQYVYLSPIYRNI